MASCKRGLAPALYGEAGRDTLNGSLRDDRLYAYLGADTVLGGLGSDWLDGHEGRDELRGEGGEDHLHGSAGGKRTVFWSLNEAMNRRWNSETHWLQRAA